MAQALGTPTASLNLMKELQSTDFVLLELTLYLDTHPDDVEAITQYNRVAEQRKSLLEKVEAKFGAVRNYEAGASSDSWNWSSSPWPWQL